MEEIELTPTLTPCSAQDMASALAYAWRSIFEQDPIPASICILLAQWALETGRGRSCRNWNIGNYKHVPGDGRSFTYFRCNEILNGKIVWFDPSRPADRPYCCFRAYSTIEAGAHDYVASLYRHFRSAWPAVERGNPHEFSHSLKVAGYYTADESDYTKGIISLFLEFSHLSFDLKDPSAFSEDERREILALVSLTAREMTE